MTNRWQKLIRSLHLKKNREEQNLFIVEGKKSIIELLYSDFQIEVLFITEEFSIEHSQKLRKKEFEVVVCKQSLLEQVGTLQTNDSGIAIVKIPQWDYPIHLQALSLILDDIKDPGNLGTIVRLADWFGISQIICSPQTTDFFAPKVILSTMGSFTRTKVYYTDLQNFIKKLDRNTFEIWGGFMQGLDIHKFRPQKKVILVIGSESHGISPQIEALLDGKLTIPRLGKAESLNAAMACGIMCDQICNQMQLS
ncbi:MAG: RNA methyltransferase [Flammeovirgaceae bacterium]